MASGKRTNNEAPPPEKPGQPPRPRSEIDVGLALRSAYKLALDEAIPPEMLDLLNKLK